MSIQYQAVGWNRQKKIYDSVLAGACVLYVGLFAGIGFTLYPTATAETLLIRAFGTLALLLLHMILSIGPLCRLDRRFLALLYNRRHLGVTMFLAAFVHGIFSLIQFHALGDESPLASLFSSNTRFDSIAQFPFELLGFAALVILFAMAATSHDFWLHQLSVPVWKTIHMAIYGAYALLVAHVALGAIQSDSNPVLAMLLTAGFIAVSSLHLIAAAKGRRVDLRRAQAAADGFVEVCNVDAIPDKRARVVSMGGERIAIFRYENKVSAVSNVCRHQNGPLGEGRIVDGCITCPWHGYQYAPETGTSPAPFTDKVSTFLTRIVGTQIFVHPRAQRPGTRIEPSLIRVPAAPKHAHDCGAVR